MVVWPMMSPVGCCCVGTHYKRVVERLETEKQSRGKFFPKLRTRSSPGLNRYAIHQQTLDRSAQLHFRQKLELKPNAQGARL